MSGSVVARSINEVDADPAVKNCLMALFTFELTSSNNKKTPYKKTYETEISKHASDWNSEGTA
jgi:hypothetical protein